MRQRPGYCPAPVLPLTVDKPGVLSESREWVGTRRGVQGGRIEVGVQDGEAEIRG